MQLQGRTIEAEAHTGEWKNLVVIAKSDKLIFSLDDTKENTDIFLQELSAYIPMIDGLNYSFMEKLMRKLKL